MNHWLALLLGCSLMMLTGCGCNVDFSTKTGDTGAVISEGTVYSVTYQQTDGKATTITRSSAPPANGTWNVDVHGKLTSQALVLTYPGRRDLGPHVIPFDRIVEVQFGDGGIQNPGLGSLGHEHASPDHAEH